MRLYCATVPWHNYDSVLTLNCVTELCHDAELCSTGHCTTWLCTVTLHHGTVLIHCTVALYYRLILLWFCTKAPVYIVDSLASLVRDSQVIPVM